MKKILFLISALVASLLYCDEPLESLLDDVTEIATKTKLNIDYQPSVVSVLKADKLRKIGVSNLHEAIGLLPGVETSILHTGWKQVIFRGSYNPDTFVFDKYKLYIDGVDVGSNIYSTSYYYLDFPIELIDRIEVLRGSASTVYGPGAFSGAINVITKSSQKSEHDKIFASVGSFEYHKGGFIKHINEGDWHIALDGYYQANNKTLDASDLYVSDRENDYQRDDYKSLENFEDIAFGITAKKENFEFTSRYKKEKTDNFYGLIETLEPVNGGYQENESGVVEFNYKHKLADDLELLTKTGLNYYKFEFDSVLINDFQGSTVKIHFHPVVKELKSYLDIGVNGKNIENHSWKFGFELQKINIIKNVFGTTYRDNSGGKPGPAVNFPPPVTDPNLMTYLDDEFGFLRQKNNQFTRSLYLQDLYSPSDSLDFSFNLRMDDSTLFDEMFSYRFGSVYRLDDENVLKAIYGRSYRAPSYIEAFQAEQEGIKLGNPNIKPEYIDTYELGYTHKKSGFVSRTNLFYSITSNVIDYVEDPNPPWLQEDYGNHQKRTSRGIESELFYNMKNGIELMVNFSYVRTQYFSPNYYTPVEYQSPEISEVLSKGYLLYPLDKSWSLNTAWFYNGPKKGYQREGSSAPNSRTIDSTFVVDETLVYIFDPSSTFTFTVKNLFDTTIMYPSFQQKNGEIRREGRNWLVTYEKRF